MEIFGFNTKYVPNDYGYVKQLILASRPDMDKNMVSITTKKSKENHFHLVRVIPVVSKLTGPLCVGTAFLC